MKIVFLDAETLHPSDLDFSELEQLGAFTSFPYFDPKKMAQRLEDPEVVITSKVLLGEQELAAASQLKLICIAATGTNNIDLEAARRLGIAVCNVPSYSTSSVAQHTLGLLLSLAGNYANYFTEAPSWSQSNLFTRLEHPICEVEGLQLGVVGLGDIGKAVAQRARAFGLKVVALQRETGQGDGMDAAGHPVERLPREDFFRTSHIVSLHCPLTEETRGMMDVETLQLLPRGAFLINTGRGGLVVESDLVAALRSGHLGGAALDVLSQEPPPEDHPLLDPTLPNLIVTPHIAWGSQASRSRLVEELVANIAAFQAGKERNRVV